MEDEKMRQLLKEYMEKEMDLIVPEEMEGFDQNFSKRFEGKMKKVMWKEKYFGQYTRFIHPMRRVAMVAAAILSLLVVGNVSAKVFNIQPWKYFTSYKEDDKMDEKVYTHKDAERHTDRDVMEVKKKIPDYVPNGMEQGEVQETTSFVDVQWEGEDDSAVSYTRAKISEGMKTSTDAEYQSKKSIVVAGYRGVLYKKNDEMWIDWDDTEYNHFIMSVGIDDENELLKMAESLYKSDDSKK